MPENLRTHFFRAERSSNDVTASAEVASHRNLHTEARLPVIIAVLGFTNLVYPHHFSP